MGRCPKPHQRRRLWTPQGADEKGRSPSLDPFRAIELTSLSYFFRVLIRFLPLTLPFFRHPHQRIFQHLLNLLHAHNFKLTQHMRRNFF